MPQIGIPHRICRHQSSSAGSLSRIRQTALARALELVWLELTARRVAATGMIQAMEKILQSMRRAVDSKLNLPA
jgi:hypothetical protein